jgi:hypothetical protein
VRFSVELTTRPSLTPTGDPSRPRYFTTCARRLPCSSLATLRDIEIFHPASRIIRLW